MSDVRPPAAMVSNNVSNLDCYSTTLMPSLPTLVRNVPFLGITVRNQIGSNKPFYGTCVSLAGPNPNIY